MGSSAASLNGVAPAAPRRGIGGLEPVRALAAGAIGLGCGLSVFFAGFYDLSVFGPIGLGLLGVMVAMVIASAPPRGAAAWLALGGLVALWLWTLLSSQWAESAGRALVEADRWLVYVAAFGVLVYLIRTVRLGAVALAAATAGVLVLAGYLTAALLAGDAGVELFVQRRLSDPFQYTNALGSYLLLGFWPLIAVAERRRQVLLAAPAAGAATLVACLLVLTQSRGVAVAFAASAVVLLALVPGRRDRGWLLLLVLFAVTLVSPELLAVYRSSTGGLPTEGSVRTAAGFSLLAGVSVTVLWAAVELVSAALARRGADSLRRARRSLEFGLAGGALVGVVILAGLAGRITDQVERQYDAFVRLDPSVSAGASPDSRLVSGGGNRYDYWRIALDELGQHPVRGVGAGNYHFRYFRERSSTEDIRQPHSIVMQSLAEVGLVGTLALAVFLLGVALGLLAHARAGRTSLANRALAVAAGGIFVAWLSHTSADWLHLIPGLTGIALCAAAALVGAPARAGPPGETRRPRALVIVPAVVLAVAGAALLSRGVLAEHHRAKGQRALPDRPAEALSQAKRSLAYEDEALASYYLRAAAYARLDRYPEARAALLEAVRREPHDWVSWGLLGDLAVRAGDVRAARAAYRRASALNPRDPALRRLVADPAAALGR